MHAIQGGTDMYAFITGATSGIGKEIAYLLAQEKMDLLLSGRRVAQLEEIQADIQQRFFVQVQILPADLSVRSEVYELHKLVSAFQPEIVINNAGFGVVDHFIDSSLDTELSMLETNIVSLHILTKLFARSMTKGKILNVASMAAFLPTPKMASYAASKSYVYHFSEAINYEMKKVKPSIQVLSLCPGPVDTGFAQVAGVHMALPGISAKKCAKIAVKGLLKGKRVSIPGFSMKLTRFFVRFIPTRLLLAISYRLQQKK